MEYSIPEKVSIEVEGEEVTVKAGGKEQALKFNQRMVKVERKGEKLVVSPNGKETRKTKAAVNSILKHLENAVRGLEKPFEKKLQIVYAHFPVSVEVKGEEIIIKNFLGEKVPRKAKTAGKAKVGVKGQEITVSGSSKEDVGQTASNIVRATKITNKDTRVFQDGIYYAES